MRRKEQSRARARAEQETHEMPHAGSQWHV